MAGIAVELRRAQVAPIKVRQVCNLVRKKKAREALKILRFCEKKSIAIMLTKLINSALSIASDSDQYDLENLMIHTLYVGQGRTLKRIQPRAQGRAYRIRKRTSHVFLELREV